MIKYLLIALAVGALACTPPPKPPAPVGCSASDARLISMSDGSCKWYFCGCNED